MIVVHIYIKIEGVISKACLLLTDASRFSFFSPLVSAEDLPENIFCLSKEDFLYNKADNTYLY